MRRLGKSQEHLAASELLFALFKGSIALEQLADTLRSAETDHHTLTSSNG